ncbi:hypothetical protein [Puniceibacterium sediminis]|uniref:Flagellar FliJ protein n=1 Tax=Puniceibacterium sediminis TaxID=1608407 RepID=A0A238VSI5_9RHOB|nr:hypothetical protein [Puniceibacterium sediminis]SNR37131.1 hypothetical protein SAMN06265370_10389 [Puniceibacterium sediminis]
MSTEFDDIREITAIMEERALAKHRDVLAQEAAVNREIVEIEKLRYQTLRQDDGAQARRMLGADGLWQGWLAQRRMHLNQDLAMLRVRKADSLHAAQTAFARHQVTTNLASDARAEQHQRRISQSERRLEEGFHADPDGWDSV